MQGAISLWVCPSNAEPPRGRGRAAQGVQEQTRSEVQGQTQRGHQYRQPGHPPLGMRKPTFLMAAVTTAWILLQTIGRSTWEKGDMGLFGLWGSSNGKDWWEPRLHRCHLEQVDVP